MVQAYVCFGCAAVITGVKDLGKHLRYCKEHKIPREMPFHRYVRTCARNGRFQRALSRPLFICPHCARYRTLESAAYKRHQAVCARAAWRIRAMEIRSRKSAVQARSARSLGYYRAQAGAGKSLEYYQTQVKRVNATFAELTLMHQTKIKRRCELEGLKLWEGEAQTRTSPVADGGLPPSDVDTKHVTNSPLLIWASQVRDKETIVNNHNVTADGCSF